VAWFTNGEPIFSENLCCLYDSTDAFYDIGYHDSELINGNVAIEG
jgi:hypothetical protein